MKKLVLASLCILWLGMAQVFAQTRTITGTVTAKEDGSPIPGVSVMIKGSNTGVTTGADGKYSINASSGSTLVFSYISYESQQIAVGEKNTIDVALILNTRQLTEVVVTANDIKREKRTLGYSAPTVSNKELTEGGNPSVLSSLSGRVAGVNISSTANTPGSSTRIVLRGGSSISGNNQALMIVDGVPIDNTNQLGGEGGTSTASAPNNLTSVDFGNRGNDIDPSDVESISILKGPAAAALYGSRASNGAVVITTKSGANRSKKTEITLNSTNTFSSILKMPDFQHEYGQGAMTGALATNPIFITGIDDGSDNFSWGGPFTGKDAPWGQEINGITQTKPYADQPDNIRKFFTTGFTSDNSIGISSGNDKSTFYLGLNSLNSDGIYPGNHDTYNKYGVRFNGKATLANNFTAGINFNYNKIQQNAVASGQGANGLWINILQTPRDIPLNTLGDLNNRFNGYDFGTNTYGYYNAFALNPYWVLQNYSNVGDVNRVTGSFNLTYKPLSWLNIVERVGIDSYSDRRRLIAPKYAFDAADESGTGVWAGLPVVSNGSYEVDQYNVNEVNHDLMITATHSFGKDLTASLLLGNNIRERSTTTSETSTNVSSGLIIPNWYDLQNSNGPLAALTDYISTKRLVGFYADLNLAYRNFLYLEGTLRNDRSSTLPTDNYSYFYPSVNGSFVFSELFKNSGISNILSYGKLRSSFAQVGSDTNPYQLLTYYGSTTVRGSFGNTKFPFGSVSAFQLGNTIGNNHLLPEKTNAFEIGTELSFLQGRLSVDFSYYVNDSKNQILPAPIPFSTGSSFSVVNAGEIENKGIELSLNGTPVKTNWGLTWDLFGTFTKNNSNVVSLPNGVQQIVLGGTTAAAIVAAKGMPYGEFYAVTDAKDAQGRTIVSQTTGLPTHTATAQYLGSYNPQYQASLGTSIKYKGLEASVLFDVKHGGVFYSNTKQILDFVGTSAETGGARFGQPFPNSVYLDGAGKSVVNTTIPYSKYQYYIAENSPGTEIVDASYVKMRSASLSYTLTKKQLRNLPFGALTVGLFGNNLFIWTPKSNQFADPEVNSGGASNEQGFDFTANPSVRNYGINLKVSF